MENQSNAAIFALISLQGLVLQLRQNIAKDNWFILESACYCCQNALLIF